ncbi:MAG: hypothetical protein MHPSP_003817, partial [Paramarteilia canceri]
PSKELHRFEEVNSQWTESLECYSKLVQKILRNSKYNCKNRLNAENQHLVDMKNECYPEFDIEKFSDYNRINKERNFLHSNVEKLVTDLHKKIPSIIGKSLSSKEVRQIIDLVKDQFCIVN